MSTLLHLEDLSRRFGGLAALDQLTLDVHTGSRHAIIGPNGAGKSTLLHLIAGTLHPSSGRILLDGHPVTHLTPTARARRGIGRTWQHPAVFPRLTVTDNLTLATCRRGGSPQARLPWSRRHTADPQITEALDQAGLTAEATTRAGALSYGHQRRLEVAMAVANQPRLLLLDEPSAGLDPHDTARLVDVIEHLPADVTVLLIDHNLDLVWALADTVTVLDHGQHLATGTPEDIRTDPRVQSAYLNP